MIYDLMKDNTHNDTNELKDQKTIESLILKLSNQR